ncbi:MipA/OmpV family protein [Jannaschia pohangensis]|uniref:Outer membrane scaffolding protein for murein synthesis, MipA/OmpV family n=1 Tax=Jannaschia pohangensis TaxID=390807 RepID=A0A1I3N7B6_9RHOB|nr:MipA/OmpV family protein [Jannaschia pohangensis]SFJ05153.1 Outer membrane scaffolding protein for murein synthesis, MipA/OmpV family [Jannaschia pohangensis]
MLRLTFVALALTTAAASAQTLDAPVVSSQSQGAAIGFTLRGGVQTTPEYFGSSDNETGPALGFELNYLRLGGYTFGSPDPLYYPEGFGFTGSFRYIGEREAADYPELTGLADVDASLEIGGGLRYATQDYQVFGVIRYGIIGHESFVGELGADALARPTDRLTLRAGPRLLFGDSDYAATYFGVTAAEAGTSAFGQFDASGGLLSAGVELGAAYQLSDNWGIDATVSYDRLQNDAARSPITTNDSSVSASIGITRRFSLGF